MEGKIDFTGVSIEDLAKAAMQAFARTQEKTPLGSVVIQPKITIRDKILSITQTLRLKKRASFWELLGNSRSRSEVVATFIAILELVKRYLVSAEQSTRFGDIEIISLEDIDDSSEFDIEFSE
ncbi:MAG: segregation/condensation protein A [Chloroflexi bacterium]|nr:segregation/condensation protein A [Chloroflexota bacterium]